jgi:hypothetical protein
MRFILALVVLVAFSACTKTCVEKDNSVVPACILSKIEQLKTQPKGNPAYSVYQYTYNGKKVYYFPPQCCDQFSELYDSNCNLICRPSGGIGGGGDGTCTDFTSTRKDEVLIWKDNR